MYVCISIVSAYVLWPPTYSMCAHMHCVLCPYIHVYSCQCVCIQGLCQTHCVGMVLTSVYCVWLVCLFRRVYDACLMCTLYSPCVCTVSVQLCTVYMCPWLVCLHTSFRCKWFGHCNVYMPTHTCPHIHLCDCVYVHLRCG